MVTLSATQYTLIPLNDAELSADHPLFLTSVNLEIKTHIYRSLRNISVFWSFLNVILWHCPEVQKVRSNHLNQEWLATVQMRQDSLYSLYELNPSCRNASLKKRAKWLQAPWVSVEAGIIALFSADVGGLATSPEDKPSLSTYLSHALFKAYICSEYRTIGRLAHNFCRWLE